MCESLPPLRYRLRAGERPGIGPWEDSYFKRKPTEEEERQDRAEQQAICEKMIERGRRLNEEAAERDRRRREEELRKLAGVPIPEIETLLNKVKWDSRARDRVIALIEGLDSDDPRRSHYRRELANRLF
ncbi:MAG: hypothetical protein M0Z47_00060 [Actinomycetota bacterium]|nr:hypothetical protein [Actinomycetota bacterium]